MTWPNNVELQNSNQGMGTEYFLPNRTLAQPESAVSTNVVPRHINDMAPYDLPEGSDITIIIDEPYFSRDAAVMVAANRILERVHNDNTIEYGVGIFYDNTRNVHLLTTVREGNSEWVELDSDPIALLPPAYRVPLFAPVPNASDFPFVAHVHSHATHQPDRYAQIFSLDDYVSYYKHGCIGYLVADLKITPFDKATFVQCKANRVRCRNSDRCRRDNRINCQNMKCTEGTDIPLMNGILMRFTPPPTGNTVLQPSMTTIEFMQKDQPDNVVFRIADRGDLQLFHGIRRDHITRRKYITLYNSDGQGSRIYDDDRNSGFIGIVEETKQRQIFNHYGVEVTHIISFDNIVNSNEAITFKKINYPLLSLTIQNLETRGMIVRGGDIVLR
jgi:hypothetical protein